MQGLRIVSAIGAALTAEEIDAAHRVAHTHQEMRFGVVRIEDRLTGVVVEYHAGKRLAMTVQAVDLLSSAIGLASRNTASEVGIVFASTEDGVYPASENNTSSVFSTDGALLASVPILTGPLRNVFLDINGPNQSKKSTETALWNGEISWPLWQKDPTLEAGQIDFDLPENSILPIGLNQEYRLGKSTDFVAETKIGVLRAELNHLIKGTYSPILSINTDSEATYSGVIAQSSIRSYEEYQYSITLFYGASSEQFTGTVRITQRSIVGIPWGDSPTPFFSTVTDLVFTNFPINITDRVPFVTSVDPLRVAIDEILDNQIFHNGNFGIINGSCFIAPEWNPGTQTFDYGKVARTGPPYVTAWGDESEPISYPMTDFSGLAFSEPGSFQTFFASFINQNPAQVLTFLVGYGSNSAEFGMFPRADDVENITKAHVYGVARWAFNGSTFQFVDWLDPIAEHATFAWSPSYGTPNCVLAQLFREPSNLKSTLAAYPSSYLKYAYPEGDIRETMRNLILAVTGRGKPNRQPPA